MNIEVHHRVYKKPFIFHYWASAIQPTPSLPISLQSILLLYSNHCVSKIVYEFFVSSMCAI
jgi:hypothetical protein